MLFWALEISQIDGAERIGATKIWVLERRWRGWGVTTLEPRSETILPMDWFWGFSLFCWLILLWRINLQVTHLKVGTTSYKVLLSKYKYEIWILSLLLLPFYYYYYLFSFLGFVVPARSDGVKVMQIPSEKGMNFITQFGVDFLYTIYNVYFISFFLCFTLIDDRLQEKNRERFFHWIIP